MIEEQIMATQGAWKYRNSHMKKLIEDNICDGYMVLEIGAWAGKSSCLWAEACKGKGLVYVIDNWNASENAPEGMKQAVKDNLIFPYFLDKIREYNNVVILKGNSDQLLPIFKEKTFDFIYIDGDHSYSQFKRDLISCWFLLKDGGILCGDDYEVSADKIDTINAYNHKEEDFITDPKTKIKFHPGITLSLMEFNTQNIIVQDGFWHIKK